MGALLLTGSAWAAEPVDAIVGEPCADVQLVKPFAAFGDLRDYALMPGGSFDDPAATDWALEDGAALDGGALTLPEGASATSPAMCVDLNWPTLRLMASQARERKEKLLVEVLYPDADGKGAKWRKAENLKAEGEDGWHATVDVELKPEHGGRLPGGRALAVRFTSQGDWRIDDVYVDPRNR